MVGAAVDLLAREMSETFHDMRSRLHGLTEAEFFWEPVPDAWTVFRREDGRWDSTTRSRTPARTVHDHRVASAHVAMCKVMYHEYAYGPGRLTWPEFEPPATPEAVEMLDTGHGSLTEDLAALDDAALETSVLTNWGERWPAWRIFWTTIHHDAHHGGEIGALRDLYRTSDAAGRFPTGGRLPHGARR